MRILGFSKKWDKLNQDMFTTFRFPRKDRDWGVEELVQVVYKPRTKGREPLGIARIMRKQEKDVNKTWSYYPRPSFPNTPDMITPLEAKSDGFDAIHGGGDIEKLRDFLRASSSYEQFYRIGKVNKLTLYWVDNTCNA